ncbi:MAG: endonuclease/exonuclease/phosphatase family protein [Flavobacteriaceae bacterium]
MKRNLRIYLSLLFLLYFGWSGLFAQHDKYAIRSVFFYNVENLFDTINDPKTFDDPRTTQGKDKWNAKRYNTKLDRLARVISSFGPIDSTKGPDLLGLCEVENHAVLDDLVHHPQLLGFQYGIIHGDSPDERGMDVALVYKRSAFIPIAFQEHRLWLFNEEQEVEYTRNQLVVAGQMDEEEYHIIVNHWPSRRGGEARSKPYRIAAAKLTDRILDSIKSLSEDPRIIVMGDFNDNPIDASIKHVLKATGSKDSSTSETLFNPMEKLFRKGIGSLAYRDKWSLFDQIILSGNLTRKSKGRYYFWQAGVYKPDFLIDPRGRYKGYPFRTYAAGKYQGGYSDHFPVYVWLIKKLK